MKILIFNWRDIKNPDAGGAETFTHENAKRLVAMGHSVTVFASAFENCLKEENIDGVNIVRAGGKYSVYWKAKEYYKKYFKGKYDVVIDGINTRPFLTPKFVVEPIVPLIYQLAREFWFYETRFPISYIGYYFLEKRWLGNYLDIPTITISESTRRDLIDLGFRRVSIVPVGINFKSLESPLEKEKDPTLIFVGRLKKAKLPDHAIKAFKIIKKKLPTAKLWVVGDGYYRKELEKMSCSGVEFFGKAPTEKKFELMSRAHAILVPGVREGWGLVVTEANAMGTPAIGYNIPGLRDSIKDGKTGFLCWPNPEAMAKETIKMLENTDIAKKMSRNSLEDSRNYTWSKSAKKFEEFLRGDI